MAPGAGAAPRRSWGEAVAAYSHPRVVSMLFLGFSAGLPFLLIFSTLSAWLREAGVERTTIGFFSWLGITFSIKVLWAPIVDRTPLPYLTRRLGRRRAWLLPAQLAIAAGLLGIAASDPSQDLLRIALFGLVIAFASATQDVALDAYRIEAVERTLQGAMSASYILGYRLALLAAGAGALYVAAFVSWHAAYAVMAACMGVGILTVLIVKEPEVNASFLADWRARLEEMRVEGLSHTARAGRFVKDYVVAPFLDFIRRHGWLALAILAFIGVYRLSDITMGVMANPFYIDLGFSKEEIASVTKLFGFFMTIAGALIGGVLVARFGILRPLLLGAVMVAATNLLFAWLATQGADVAYLAVTVSADNLSGGLAGSAFIAYLSSLTNSAYTATQYALFSSLMTLPGKFIGGFSGMVVDEAGYTAFFVYASALGLPAIILVIFLMTRRMRSLQKEQLEEGAA